jgi:catecholate siderophore receptor
MPLLGRVRLSPLEDGARRQGMSGHRWVPGTTRHQEMKRMPLRKPRFSPLCVALFGAAVLPLHAQTAETTEIELPDGSRVKSRALKEVQVTGKTVPFKAHESSTGMKGSAPLRDIPQTVNVVPQAVIESQGAINVSDALRNVAGITLASGEGGFRGDNISIRGFAARTDRYVDGVRDNGQYARDTFNVERVEVLQGASSMLFGRGGTGGVVNTITKRPSGDPSANVNATLGSHDFKRITADVDQPLSEAAGVRVAALWHDAESFRDVVETERKGLAPSFALQPGDATRIDVSLLWQEQNGIGDYGTPWNNSTNRPANVPRSTFYGPGKDAIENFDVYAARATVSHDFSDTVTLRNTTGYDHVERLLGYARPGGVTSETATTLVSLAGNQLRGNSQINLGNQTDLLFDLRTGAVEHHLASGLELGWEDFAARAIACNNNPAFSPLRCLASVPLFDPQSVAQPALIRSFGDFPPSSYTKVDTETRALYLQDRMVLSDAWSVVGGLRWDRFSAEQRNFINGERFDRTDTYTSYRLGAVFQPSEMQSWYATWSTSFNPSAETFSLSASTAALDPEENRNFEVGVKLTPWGERFGLNFAAFDLTKTNARTVDANNSSVTVLEGEQRTRGVQADLQGNLSERWLLSAGVALMDPEVTRSNTVTSGIPLEGKTPTNAPESQANLWAVYDLGNGFEMGGGAFYTGKRYADATNLKAVGAYTRWDAYAAWRNGPMRVALNGYNLSDEDYIDHAHSAYVTWGEPRSVRLSFSYSY